MNETRVAELVAKAEAAVAKADAKAEKAASKVEALREALYRAEQAEVNAMRSATEARSKLQKAKATCQDCGKSLARARNVCGVVDPVTGDPTYASRCASCQAKARKQDPASVWGPNWKDWA